MPPSCPRYYIDLRGEDYDQRFLVDGGERFAAYEDDERIERLLTIAEEHLDYLSDGRATDHPRFVDRTHSEPPEPGHPLVVDEVTFWPLPRQT